MSARPPRQFCFLLNATRIAASFIAISVISLSGCGKNNGPNENAQVRLLNLAPESGAISIKLKDDSNVINWQSDVGYKTTTDFKDIETGSIRVRVSNAGGVIIDNTMSFSGQRKQLVVVYGGKSSISLGTIGNDIASSSSGKSKLRLQSFAVGLSSYDLYMTTNSEDYRSVEPKVRNMNGTVYEVDTGTYTIRLTSPGTKDVVFEMPSKAFDDRKYYNLILYNEGSAQLPNAFWLKQDDDTAPELITNAVTRIRAINAQSLSPNVNVNIGSTRVFSSVPFGGISSFALATAGTRTVAFNETINSTTVGQVNGSFTGGRDYSVFLSPGATAGTYNAFSLLDSIFPPSSGKIRARLVNASTVADLALAVSFSAITPTIGSYSGSGYVEVIAGDGTPVTITQGAAATPVLSDTQDLSSGRTYSFVVSGGAGALKLSVRQDN